MTTITSQTMASNDATRKASAASSSEVSLVGPAVVTKLLPKYGKVPGKHKLKKPLPKLAKLKDEEGTEGKLNAVSRSHSPDSPLVNDLDHEKKPSFPTGRPIEDHPELMLCKHCKKPMEKSVSESHLKICLQKKQDRARKKKEAKEAKAARDAKEKFEEKEREKEKDKDKEREKEKEKEKAKEKEKEKEEEEKHKDNEKVKDKGKEKEKETDKDGDTHTEEPSSTVRDLPDESGPPPEGITKSAKKSAAKATTDGPKKSKKRKAEGEGGDKEPKKKKAKKDEPPKPKVPKPKGPVDVEKQCGVVLPNGGNCARSLTCKSHSMGAKRSVPGRSLPYDLLLAQYQKKNQAKQQKAAMDANAPLPDEMDTAGPVDSDEEKDAVMAAIARARPQPLAQHIFVPTRRKYALVRMKEMLGNALGGKGLFGSGASAGAVGGYAMNSNSGAYPASAGGNVSGSGEAGSSASAAGQWTEGAAEGVRRASFTTQASASGSGALQRTGTAAGGSTSRKASASTASVAA